MRTAWIDVVRHTGAHLWLRAYEITRGEIQDVSLCVRFYLRGVAWSDTHSAIRVKRPGGALIEDDLNFALERRESEWRVERIR